MHNTNLHFLGQVLTHGASEVVGRSESCALATKRRHCGVPLTHLALGVAEVYGSHHLESLRHILIVLSLGSGVALHVRLSKAEINLEVGVGTVRHTNPLCQLGSYLLQFFSLGKILLVITRGERLGSSECLLKSLACGNRLLACQVCASLKSSLGVLYSLQEFALVRCAHNLEAHPTLP